MEAVLLDVITDVYKMQCVKDDVKFFAQTTKKSNKNPNDNVDAVGDFNSQFLGSTFFL